MLGRTDPVLRRKCGGAGAQPQPMSNSGTLGRRKRLVVPPAGDEDEGYFSMQRRAGSGEARATVCESPVDLAPRSLGWEVSGIAEGPRKTFRLPQEVVLSILGCVDNLSALWSYRCVNSAFRDAAEFLVLHRLKEYALHMVAPTSLRRRRRGADGVEFGDEDEPTLAGQTDFLIDSYDPLGYFSFKPDPLMWNGFSGHGASSFRIYISHKSTGNVVSLWDLDVDVGTRPANPAAANQASVSSRRSFAVRGNILVRFDFAWPTAEGSPSGVVSEAPQSPVDVLDTGLPENVASSSSWLEWLFELFSSRSRSTTPAQPAGSGSFAELVVTPGRLFRALAPVGVLRRRKTVIRRRSTQDSVSWLRPMAIEEAVSYLEQSVRIPLDYLHHRDNFGVLLDCILKDRSVLRGGRLERMEDSELVRKWSSAPDEEKAAANGLMLRPLESFGAAGMLIWCIWAGLVVAGVGSI
ncbi:hypothetical protein DFJ74DRAFT_333844 [Hyaloraphidium curvatum]|nr:hypothetical protein DFJ74DRAFT_333844 [Hyaloraphidium curvatum]